MNKLPIQLDGRFRLGDVLGSGSYAVVYHAWNIMKNNVVAVKLKLITDNSSSVESHWFSQESTYHAMVLDLLGPSLQDLFLMHNQRFSLCTIVNLGDQLYIHSYNYVHSDIKLQNVLMGLGNLKHTPFIIDFGVTKEYRNPVTRAHIPFHHRQHLTGTPAFTSINNHLGVEIGCRDDLESLTYMLIYFLHGCLPWLTDDHEKLSSSAILECKVNTSIEVLCHGVPAQITTVLVYSCCLAFSEDPDYEHIRSLLHDLRSAPMSAKSNASL
ncbi:kinase-like domain-containing protein [Suillus ampliporus]|nr:kinase-like domain-containing protein [Suillus ampliporus]